MEPSEILAMGPDPTPPAASSSDPAPATGSPEPEPGAPRPGFRSRPGSRVEDGSDSAGVAATSDPWPTTTPTTWPSAGSEDDLTQEWDGKTPPRRPFGEKVVRPFLAELVENAGTAANERSVDRGRGHPDQWLTDEADRTVAEPLARIVNRLLPAEKLADPTLRDAIEAGLIIARYVLKQLNLSVRWRRANREAMDPLGVAETG